jgi:hypothetical protein
MSRSMAGTAGIIGLDVAVFRHDGFVERPTIWSGVDAITTGDRASKEYKARKVSKTNADGAGSVLVSLRICNAWGSGNRGGAGSKSATAKG